MVTSVVPKARLDNPSGSSVAAFFGKNRFEMFLKTGYRVKPIKRSCKLVLLSCRTFLSRSDLKTMNYSCYIYSYVSILQRNHRKTGTKASCKWTSCANRNNKKRGRAPSERCSVIAVKVCTYLQQQMSRVCKASAMCSFSPTASSHQCPWACALHGKRGSDSLQD